MLKKQFFVISVILLLSLSLSGCNENTNSHNNANDNTNKNNDYNSSINTSTDTFLIITPYVNESDVSSVGEAYSIDENNPYWGFWHPGIDFMITKDFAPVQAAIDGTICIYNISKNPDHMGWHAGFGIKFNSTWSVCYNLETCSQSDEIGQKMMDNFFIQDGQFVHKGEIIANLIYGGDGAHIDFGVSVSENRICPEPFFTTESKESVLRLIHKDHPDWCICYPPTNPSEQTNQNTQDNLSIITPYVNESDIDSVPEAYGLADTNPYWNFRHPGIDFKTSKDLIQVRASTSGTITNINIAKESGQMGWHVGFLIQYNSYYSVSYNLETFSKSDEIEQKVRDNLFIEDGQIVQQGDIIANLVYGGDGCHIDFGVCIPGNRICPEPFFTEDARVSVMRLIQKDHPDWPMCCD